MPRFLTPATKNDFDHHFSKDFTPVTKTSYQLYSSRKFGPLAATLKMVADFGYDQVEGYGALYASLDDLNGLKAALSQNNLHMKSGHFSLDMVEGDATGVLNIARTLDISHVFVPHLAADLRPNDADGWRAFGARLSAAGKPLTDAGLAFGWHNHDFEFTALPDGSFPIEAILDGGPDLGFEFDVAWAVRGGQDPLHWLDRYKDRIVAAHIKDIAPDGQCADEDGWADVGQGVMDWTGLMTALRGIGCELFVAEHDNPSDDARFARRTIEFMKSL